MYKKHDSFFALKHRKNKKINSTLNRIVKVSKDISTIEKLSSESQKVFKQVTTDLLDDVKTHSNNKFNLKSNVIAEIDTITDSNLPRYLVHRYRYEIFPQTKTIDNFPPYLQIEPTSICNYRCVFCFETDETFTNKKNGYMGEMTLDLFKKVIDQAEGNIEFISLASRGEPLACSDIIKMLEYTNGKFLNLKINTNASLLDEKKCHAILSGGVKTVVFSADAATEPLYSKLRVNGSLSKVLKNIENFTKIKETKYQNNPIISRVSGVKFSNEQNLNSMEKMWGDLVDQVAFVNYNPWENSYNKSPNNIIEPCSDLWRRMFVWWDGKINPCDVDYKSILSVGNISKNNIQELWNSKEYRILRETHLNKKRQNIRPCSSCVVI
jgi:radical SAM protein with 4Fe4S-binding SPASM domain